MAPSSSGPGRPQWHERRTAPHAIGEHSSSTPRWNDVPRGTMDEVSSFVRLDLPSLWRQGRHLDCSASSSNPIMEGPWCRFRREARARERHRHRSGGSLKALDPDRPIREADMRLSRCKCPLSGVKRTLTSRCSNAAWWVVCEHCSAGPICQLDQGVSVLLVMRDSGIELRHY